MQITFDREMLMTFFLSSLFQVDLVFATKGKLGEGVEEIETPHSCAEAHSFMHRKDTEFQWMADAIDAIKADGTYKTFCAKTYRGKSIPNDQAV